LTYQLSNPMNPSSSYVLQVCHHDLMQSSACVLQLVEDKEASKNHSINSSVGSATDLHLRGHRFKSWWWKIFFWNSALIIITVNTWHSKHNQMRVIWELKYFWLPIDICFCSFITAHWRHWSSIERRQWTAVVHSCQNHVDKQFNTHISQASVSKPFDHNCLSFFDTYR